MEFDQSYNGPVDWNFPSPNATPTSGSFGNNIFHTPKTATLHSHFQDAFTTPQMASYSTPHQPQYGSMTPIQRPQTSSETLRSNYYANIHSVGGVQSMPPPAHTENGFSMVSPTYGNMNGLPMQPSVNTSFGSTQIQTPPPTRGTSSRKQQYAQQIAFGTPSTIASRRLMTPQQPLVSVTDASYTQQTPLHYPQLQFSPDMYQFANIGPASAPVAPPSRIFWDQNGSPIHPIPQAQLDDPFAPSVPGYNGWQSAAPHQNEPSNVNLNTPVMNGFQVHAQQSRRASALQLPANHHIPTNTASGSAGVDPSLLYTSPIRPVVRSSGRSTSGRVQQPASDGNEKLHNRTDTLTSTETVNLRPASNLRRSNTIGATKSQSLHLSSSAHEAPSRSNHVSQIPRTASPLKRFGRPSLGSISEGRPRQRASVVLTIDENGRARTETLRASGSPTRSIRERYPALFDSDSSDDESDASDQTSSRPASFILDKRDERKAKAAKLDPPVENLEGLSIPRSASSLSMRKGIPPSRAAVAAAAQLRRQSSLRRSTPSRGSLTRKGLASRSTSSLIDSAPMDDGSPEHETMDGAERGDHNPALDYGAGLMRSSQSDNLSIPHSSAETALDNHNRRWSLMSLEQQQHPQHVSPPAPQYYHNTVFPNTGGQRLSYVPPPHSPTLLIRCICGISDDGGLPLVQCTSCTQWLHAPCVGLEGNITPPNLTCFLCTRPPSSRSRPTAAVR